MRHLFKTTIQLSIYSIFLLAISININAQSCNFTVSTIGDTAVCSGETVQLQTFVNGTLPSNASYIWSPTTGLNNPNISNPVATVTNDQTYTVKVKALDNFNLVTNGDFENGSAGFTTNYAVGTGGTWGPLSIDGTYLITTNPNIGHSNFASCSDHTPAPGTNMMVVNGASTANTNMWCQTINVTPFRDYVFSMWGISAVASSPGVLQVRFNAFPASNNFNLPTSTCNWQSYTTIWNSGNSSQVTICIVNTNLNPSGNDFAIDDISFFEICEKTASVTIQEGTPEVAFMDTSICVGQHIVVNGDTQTLPGVYFDTLMTVLGCDSIIGTRLTYYEPQKPNLGQDTSLCGNDAFTIASNLGNVSYLWNDNSTDSTLIVNQSGTYLLEITDVNGCTNADTVEVTYTPYPEVDLGGNQTLCVGDAILLSALQNDASATYLWQDGSTNENFVVQEPGGVYSVEVTINNCTQGDTATIDYQFCECIVGMPNAFTPDNDGNNDIFHALFENGCQLTSFNLKIYNRWGNLVFETVDMNEGWDGRVNGTMQAQDAYLYILNYELAPQFEQPAAQETGSFLLVR